MCKHVQLLGGIGLSTRKMQPSLPGAAPQKPERAELRDRSSENRTQEKESSPHQQRCSPSPKISCLQEIFHGFKIKTMVVCKGASANPLVARGEPQAHPRL